MKRIQDRLSRRCGGIAVVGVLAAALLAGCGKLPSDDPDATARWPWPAVAAVSKEVVAQEGPYALAVTPGQVHRCAGLDRVAARLQWKIDDPKIGEQVEVHVFGPDQAEGKLFTRGARVGEAETGEWVFEGTRFAVVDPATGKTLVSYTVAGAPCP